MYHTQRMQRVFAARFSGDGAYVFSGSDDMNVRVWKVRIPGIMSCCHGACHACTTSPARCAETFLKAIFARCKLPVIKSLGAYGVTRSCQVVERNPRLSCLDAQKPACVFSMRMEGWHVEASGLVQFCGSIACCCSQPMPISKCTPDWRGAQAQASAQQGTLLPRERHKAAYQAALVERFRHLPEVKRIERHRHLPAALYKVRGWGLGLGLW